MYGNEYENGKGLSGSAEQSYTAPTENTYQANSGTENNAGNPNANFGQNNGGQTGTNWQAAGTNGGQTGTNWQAAGTNAGQTGNTTWQAAGTTNAGQTNYSGSTWPSSQAQGNVPPKKPKKGGFFKKLVAVVASALLFGCVAGGTMVGINRLAVKNAPVQTSQGGKEIKQQAPAVSSNSSTADNSGSDTKKSSSGSTASTLDVSSIVEKAMPSVVAITGTAEVQQSNFFGQTQTYEAKAAGSGIIIGENDTELLVVTNDHVVEDTKNMKVTFIDNTTADAVVKGTDADSDVAVLAIDKSTISSDTKSKITIASIGDSDSLKVGQGVIAIGNAMGYGQSVTVGYVSALNRTIEATNDSTGEKVKTQNLVQTDAAINPGNSGGALLDMNGNVIGINESKAVATTVEGMGYAIPISKVQSVISTLSTQKTRTVVSTDKQGSIGIQGQNIDSTMADNYNLPKGIYVYKIIEGGAAAGSELQEKDVITKLDGQSISTMADLKEKLTYYSEGEKVTLTVQRQNGNGKYEEKTVEITLGSKKTLESAAQGSGSGNSNGSSGKSSSGNGNSNGKGSGNNSGSNGKSGIGNGNGSSNGGNSDGNGGSWSFSFPW